MPAVHHKNIYVIQASSINTFTHFPFSLTCWSISCICCWNLFLSRLSIFITTSDPPVAPWEWFISSWNKTEPKKIHTQNSLYFFKMKTSKSGASYFSSSNVNHGSLEIYKHCDEFNSYYCRSFVIKHKGGSFLF